MTTDATAVLSSCVACGAQLTPRAKFCSECAHPVAVTSPRGTHDVERIITATAALEGERKLVTVLFADLKGSMELIADRDPEEAHRLLAPLLEHMCDAVEKFGGTVSQVMGDGIMALFGAPASLEDHAVRACHAALTMQELVRHYGEDIQRTYGIPVQIRIGLNSGEVVLSVSGHGLHVSYTAIGQPVHIASRMEQMAKPGTVLATAETVRLAQGHIEARSFGPVAIRGFERPVEVAEIGRPKTRRSRFDTALVRGVTPFTGRDAELSQLLEAVDQVTADRKGRLAIVVGEAGIGKSRLVHEFLRSLSRMNVLALDGGAAPYGSGSWYRPGVHILRQYFNIAESDDIQTQQQKVAGRIVALDGDVNSVGAPLLVLLHALPTSHRFFSLAVGERRERVFTALMWLATKMTSERPLVLVYEDLQWTTSDTRDFLEAFVRNPQRSTLVVLTYRPDYDARWLPKGERLELRLDGLASTATHAIITQLLGSDASLAELKDELAWRSGGNPLFIEEYVRGIVESGQLLGTPGDYRIGTRHDRIDIPPTVRAVLTARIDRLARVDKHALQALSAVGESASFDVLERLVEIATEELRRSLRRLEIAGLLVERTDRGRLEYEFKHSLTQAVTYETLLHDRRRALHLAIMEALADSRDYDVLARHAVRGEAWDRAFVYLRDAGRERAAQFAAIEAGACFERALEALEHLPQSRERLEAAFDLHCDLRNALVPLGRHQRLRQVLEAARGLAEALGDDRRLAQIHSFLSNFYGNVGRSDLALQAGERSLELGQRVGATRLLIIGNMSVGEIHRTLGDYPKAREFMVRALALIEPGAELDMLGQAGLPAVRARSHLAWSLAELGEFGEARAVAETAMRIAERADHPYSVCHACLGLGGVLVRLGAFEEAQSVLARGLAVSEQVPLLRPPVAADLGVADARCGRVAEALRHVDEAVEGAREMGRNSRLPLLIAKCGEVHLLAGELAAATRLATEALRLATRQNERGNVVYANLLLAQISAHRQSGAADAEARYVDALQLAEELGMRPLAAHCHAGLGRVCAGGSDQDRAGEHLAAATRLYRAMGMRFWLAQLAPADGQ